MPFSSSSSHPSPSPTPCPTFIGLKGQPLIYAITFASSIGFCLFGYDLGFMGGLTTSPTFLAVFDNPNPSLLGFLVSSYEIGALVGAVVQFLWIGDRWGRRTSCIVGAGIVAVGAVLQTSPFGLAQFLVGRVVAGIGLGFMTTVIPIWLTECAQPSSRGRVMAMQLSNLIMGLIIANWVDYGMAKYPGSVQWRFPCALQIAFTIVVIVIVPLLPESPRYLCAAGEITQAMRTLAALRGERMDAERVVEELREITYALEVERSEEGSWMDVFRDGGISGATRVAIGFSANFFQQVSGVNVMSSLGPYVFQTSIGMSRYDALLVSGGLQVFYFLSSLIPWWAVDHVGRRRLFMLGSIGMGICMALSAIFVGIGTRWGGYAAAVCLYFFQTFFTLGWQSNMWIYPSELLPLRLRLRGGAMAVVSQWLFTFLIVEITPVMITNIGWRSYLTFAIINFATVPFVWFFYPETCGLPLEAVDLLFSARDSDGGVDGVATGGRPSILRVVKDSKNKMFMAGLKRRLQEQAVLREIDAKHRGGVGVIDGGPSGGMMEKEANGHAELKSV